MATKRAAKEGAAVLEGPRPRLWWSESKLGEALARLDAADPEMAMTEDEANKFLEAFISTEAVEAKRDEFAGFILEAEALVVAKREMADRINEQAAKIQIGVERMKREAVRIMKAVKINALAGQIYAMKLKDSRGSVAIDNEPEIPAQFFRTRNDRDLDRIEALADMVTKLARAALEGEGFAGEALEAELREDAMASAAATFLADAKAERRSVDKTEIQRHWKEHGVTRELVDPETGEVTEEPTVPGVHREVETKLVIE